jgi:hypothetical protein
MPDDKSKRGAPDRKLVSAKEPHEAAYLAKKTDIPKPSVRKITGFNSSLPISRGTATCRIPTHPLG